MIYLRTEFCQEFNYKLEKLLTLVLIQGFHLGKGRILITLSLVLQCSN